VALVERIADDVRGRGNHTSAGDIGYHYVLSHWPPGAFGPDLRHGDRAGRAELRLATGARSDVADRGLGRQSGGFAEHFMLGTSSSGCTNGWRASHRAGDAGLAR